MANELFDRAFATTAPDDTNDPPRFAQPLETVKDALVLELRRFFAANAPRSAELPTIEKYTTLGGTTDPYETVVTVLRKNPGVFERLPHVMVMASTGQQNPLSIGPPLLAAVQEPPRLTTGVEPFALADGQVLGLYTQPGLGTQPTRESQFLLLAGRFVDITAATAAELAAAINEQALYVHAVVTDDGRVEVQTGGPYGQARPNRIELAASSTPALLDALGFTYARGGGTAVTITGTAPTMTLTDPGAAFGAGLVGQYLYVSGAPTAYRNDGRFLISARTATTLVFTSKYGVAETFAAASTYFVGQHDDTTNALRPPKNRYVSSWNVNTMVQVVAPSGGDQVRTELMDLIGSFFEFWLEKKYFTILGRSVTGAPPAGVGQSEAYQLVLRSDVSLSGENEVARPDDGKDLVQTNGYMVSLHVTQYLDREVLKPGGPDAGAPWTVNADDFTADDTLPTPS